MGGARVVVSLLMTQWATGLVGVAAWSQSWRVVRRGHFRIVAWTASGMAVIAVLAAPGGDNGEAFVSGATAWQVAAASVIVCVIHLVVQYVSRSDSAASAVGAVGSGATALLLLVAPALSTTTAGADGPAWETAMLGVGLVSGGLLLGGVSNGMLLGHWYLNQPGLKEWALDRVTTLTLVAVALSLAAAVVVAPRLAGAPTEGAVLGLPGFGESFGVVFFSIWTVLVAFTGLVVWMAKRCIASRSIQSATGLYYVALLTAGVGEFLGRYLAQGSV